MTQQQLLFEKHDPNFTPAVPFVTGLSGVIGAAATTRWLMGLADKGGLHPPVGMEVSLEIRDSAEAVLAGMVGFRRGRRKTG